MREAEKGTGGGLLTDVRLLVLTLVLLGAVRLLFPGDVPFIADEPLLIDRALDALEAGSVPVSGLEGTRGVPYGPLPTWFFQVALAFTSDLRWVAAVKIVVVSGLTGLGLVVLARSIPSLLPGLGAFAFLSPYLWFYARDLWDNSFTVPFASMLLAGYARYLATDRVRWLAVAAAFGTFCLLTHFMTVPLVAAVAVHFLVTRRRRLFRDPAFAARIAGLAAVALALSLPYLLRLLARNAPQLMWSPSLRSLLFALDGFRLSSLLGFDYVIGPWRAGGMGPLLAGVSAFTYVVGIYGVYRLDRLSREGRGWSTEPSADPGPGLAAVAALTLVFWVVLANGQRLNTHPHYYGGVWIVFFLLWWLGMSHLVRQAWARRVFVGQAAAMALFLFGLVFWIHGNQGTRSLHYGPTLANQMEVARELESLGVSGTPDSRAVHPRLFPQAIGVLRRLHIRESGSPSGARLPAEELEIVYASDGGDGAIEVRRRDGEEPLRR